MPAIPVKISTIEERRVTDSTTLMAILKSRKAISLQSQVSGQIEEIYVTSGQAVEKGASLIKLDQAKQTATVNSLLANSESLSSEKENAIAGLRSLEASRQSKIATVEFCKAQLARYSQLYSQGAVSHEAVDQHNTNLKIAQSELESLNSQIKAQQATVDKDEKLIKQSDSNINEQKEQLRYYTVKAPLSGIIGDIPVKLGEYVTPSTILTTVNQTKPLEAYIDVPTDLAAKLKPGLLVELYEYEGNKSINSIGIISFISPQVNNDNQSVLAKAVIPNLTDRFRPGQLVSTRIIWSRAPAAVIPTDCVSHLSGQSFIFVVEKDSKSQLIARQRQVELGDIEDGTYRVLKGVHAGERIVRSGIQSLTDGAAITPKS